MGFIGNLHNDECLICVFTGKFENCTPAIFHQILYYCRQKELRNHVSQVIIDTTHNHIHFLNQINGKSPRSVVIDQQTINILDVQYHCYIYGSDFLFVKLRIRYCRNEPHFPAKRKSLSFQIQLNMLFKSNDERKRGKYDRIIHKSG